MSYINPYYSKNADKVTVPRHFTESARLQIQRKLQASRSPPLRHGSSPLANNSITVSSSSSSLDKQASYTELNNAHFLSSNINNNNNNNCNNISRTPSNNELTRTSSSSSSIKSNDSASGKKKKLFGAFSKLRNKNSLSDILPSSNNKGSGLFSKLKSNTSLQRQDVGHYEHGISNDNRNQNNNTINFKQQNDSNVTINHQIDNDGDSLMGYNDLVMTTESNSTLRLSNSNNDDANSLATSSAYSNTENSLFSLMTTETNNTNINSINLSMTTPLITLPEALPTTFTDMYLPEFLAHTLPNGRPLFTKRELIDWDLNDLRSLLIVDDLKPEWSNQIPIIYSPPGFRIQCLPLSSTNEEIIKTLVESDIYKERIKDAQFRFQIAKYTVMTARQRHEAMVKEKLGLNNQASIKDYYLQKYEWRNIIENFLLNLAIEAQCRHDLKKCVSNLKKQRKKAVSNGAPINSFSKNNNNNNNLKPKSSSKKKDFSNALLKMAIINGYTVYNNQKDDTFISYQKSKNASSSDSYITKDEINFIWAQVQENVYERLGLNWKPDMVTSR